MTSPSLHNATRITLKVGSALICNTQTGQLNKTWLYALAEDIATLRAEGKQVLVVSSGAVTLGRSMMQSGSGQLNVTERQAAAACGQPLLIQAWAEALGHHGIAVGQNLLTSEDSENRRRYINARNTLESMLERGIVPIVNENDTVTTDQMRYGDNDRLAARVASMSGSDTLVLLSDIDGLYTADPKLDETAKHLPLIEQITSEIEAMGGESSSNFTSGGMRTKLLAAKIATAAGCHMVIAKGDQLHPLKALDEGVKCSWFTANSNPQSARKAWIGASQQTNGSIMVDAGAAAALACGNSLLAAGITATQGTFVKGDTVAIQDANGVLLAKALVGYDANDLTRIIGLHSTEIESTLGYAGPETGVHRDNLAMEQSDG